VTAVLVLLILIPQLTTCLDNRVGLRPAMGWNPWNCFGTLRNGKFNYEVPWAHSYNDSVIRTVVDTLIALNLTQLGYEYIQLDCGWTTGFRDNNTGGYECPCRPGQCC
jgi:alpha-galactosidase